MTLKELLAGEIEKAYKIAEVLIDLVDDRDLGWKPSEGANWMTMGQLLHHLTDSCGAPMKGFATGDWGLPAGMDIADIPPEDMVPPVEKLPTVKDVAEAKALLAKDKATALETIRNCSEDRLANETLAAPWNPKEKALGYHLLEMITHLSKHTSQLFYYLKLQGKPVNTGNLWGE